MPKVSIGLPVRNGERYVTQAIESLLSQSFTDFELIITDNLSTDRTAEICAGFATTDNRVRFYQNKTNIDAARNFNKVASLARGTFFAWANHDDWWGETYLERCVEALGADHASVLSYTGSYLVDESGAVLAEPRVGLGLDAASPWERLRKYHDLLLEVERGPEHECHKQVSEGLWIPVYGLIRTEVLCKTRMIGKYISSDTVLIEEMLLHGPFQEIPDKLFFKRDHGERSMRECYSLEKRIEWFTGKKRPALMFPQWRLLRERFASVWRAARGTQSKVRCWAEIVRFTHRRRRWVLWGEIWTKVIKAFVFAQRAWRDDVRG